MSSNNTTKRVSTGRQRIPRSRIANKGNVADELSWARHEANMKIMASKIADLEIQIEVEKKKEQVLREAEKNRPCISDLPLPELVSMRDRIEMLQLHVSQKLQQHTMQVHKQSKTTHFDIGSIAHSPHFGANDNVGPSGGSPF
nr:agamous-like MADS-box protein AGL61 [Ipomoea trifida]